MNGSREASEWTLESQEWTQDVMKTPPPEDGYAVSQAEEGEEDLPLEEDEDDVISLTTGPRPFMPFCLLPPIRSDQHYCNSQHSLLLEPLCPSPAATSLSGQTPSAALLAALLKTRPKSRSNLSRNFQGLITLTLNEMVREVNGSMANCYHQGRMAGFPLVVSCQIAS